MICHPYDDELDVSLCPVLYLLREPFKFGLLIGKHIYYMLAESTPKAFMEEDGCNCAVSIP